jgi:hypothetical protein
MVPQKVFLPIIPGISMACAVLIYRCANTLAFFSFPRIPTEMPFQAVFIRGRVQALPA